MNSVPVEELGRLYLSRARYERGKSLRGSVAGATYDLVRRRADEIGADMSIVNKTKPFFLVIDFTTYVGARIGLNGKFGVDVFLLAKAKADGKELVCLETPEEQFDHLASLSPEAQERPLLNTVESFDEVADRLERIARAWATGDVDALEALTAEQEQRCREINETLIYARNERWLPHIEAYLNADRSHLLAVGVSHLVGERGILRAQRKGTRPRTAIALRTRALSYQGQ